MARSTNCALGAAALVVAPVHVQVLLATTMTPSTLSSAVVPVAVAVTVPATTVARVRAAMPV
ncbi:hypothetical protein AB0F16_28600 [Streptomyces tanashiensis]|uniref:hypothetical protein n=1 Tax=Streptomyces tanashiensis TaxID=67367 RepID=UPI0033CACFAA